MQRVVDMLNMLLSRSNLAKYEGDINCAMWQGSSCGVTCLTQTSFIFSVHYRQDIRSMHNDEWLPSIEWVKSKVKEILPL